MAESHTTFGILVFLGIVLIFSSLLATPWVYVNQPIPKNSTWGKMQTQFESFPTFNNPFNQQSTVNQYPAVPWGGSNGTGHYIMYAINGNLEGCSLYAWWNCVRNDGVFESGNSSKIANATYTVIHYAPPTYGASYNLLTLNMTSASVGGLVQSGFTDLWCKSDWPTPLNFQVVLNDPNANGLPLAVVLVGYSQSPCPVGTWGHIQIQMQTGESVPFDLSTLGHGPNLQFGMSIIGSQSNGMTGFVNGTIEIASVRTTMFVSGATADCGSSSFFSNVGCQIQQGFSFAVNIVMFGINILIFVGQLLFWFVITVGTFFTSIPVLFGADGAPPVVSAFVGAFLIGLMLYLAFTFFGKVRGTGNTA